MAPSLPKTGTFARTASPQYSIQSTQVFSPPVATRNAYSIPARSSFNYNAPRPGSTPAEVVTDDSQRLEQERQKKEQLQRDQTALAERLRSEQRAKEQALERAKGTDHVIPLDNYSTVPVGSSTVRVKIHDNDVTSFDVWVEGSWRREVKKEKGITASGTDETLIYLNSSARLYYVWEISGKLNYCKVRVRTE